jgi:hypothetical protein
MSKIDKTRENVKITNLDEKSRKDLFDRFVDAGGEVIKERRKHGLTEFDREKQKQYRQRLEEHGSKKKSSKLSATGDSKKKTKSSQEKQISSETLRTPSFIDRVITRWSIRLHLYFMRVTDFSTFYFNPAFLSQLNHEYKTALLELQLEYIDVFSKKRKTGNAIIQKLDNLNPLYFELIEMAAEVFDRTMINDIVEHSISMPGVPQRVSDLQHPLLELYRKLYILYPYQQLIYSSLEKALELRMKIEKEKSSTYSAHRKRIKNSLYIIYVKLFPRLHWLFCHYHNTIIDLADPALSAVLTITDDERPGKRDKYNPPGFHVPSNQPSEHEASAEEDTSPEEEQDVLPDHIARGLQMMNRYSIEDLREKFGPAKQLVHIASDDKILFASLLFHVFDHNYSFILTTSKIKFETHFTPDGKIDYRSRLTDLYNEMHRVNNAFDNYLHVLQAYEKARNERPQSSNHYIEYTKRLNILEKKRNDEGRQTRMMIKSVMEKISEQFRFLIDDMEGQNRVISNPQEILDFDLDIEDKKNLQGKKIYQVIQEAYCFSSAFLYRLNENGDLYGELEFTGSEKPLTMETASENKTTTSQNAKESSEKSEEEGSIIDELDDLI